MHTCPTHSFVLVVMSFYVCHPLSEVSGDQLHCFHISDSFSFTFGVEVLIHVCPIFFDRFYIKSRDPVSDDAFLLIIKSVFHASKMIWLETSNHDGKSAYTSRHRQFVLNGMNPTACQGQTFPSPSVLKEIMILFYLE